MRGTILGLFPRHLESTFPRDSRAGKGTKTAEKKKLLVNSKAGLKFYGAGELLPMDGRYKVLEGWEEETIAKGESPQKGEKRGGKKR